MSATFKYLLGFFLLAFLGVVAGAAYQYFFAKIIITPSRVVADSTVLTKYLEMAPKERIDSLDIIRQEIWKETDDCIAAGRGVERIFCFEDFIDKGRLKIFIYPNVTALASTDPQTVNRLLNTSLFLILENRLEINSEAKNLFSDQTNANLIFRW